MYAVPYWPSGGSLRHYRRRPDCHEWMSAEGYEFIPCNRRWDSDERELISRATGLYELSAEFGAEQPDRWWKDYAAAFRVSRDPVKALGAAFALQNCRAMGWPRPQPGEH